MAQVAVQATDRFERKREAILDASTQLLNSRGVKGLTLGVAAAAVDLSTTSVTYYFKRKDDLETAIDELKYRKAALPARDYNNQLRQLLTELAKVQEGLDK